MSLIPPNPVILSKFKYLIEAKYKDDPEQLKIVSEKLGPFPIFKLEGGYRNPKGEIIEFEDIEDIIESPIVEWDDIDIALNMLTRMKTKMREKILTPGFLRFMLKFHMPHMIKDEQKCWADLYLDEFPINMEVVNEEN